VAENSNWRLKKSQKDCCAAAHHRFAPALNMAWQYGGSVAKMARKPAKEMKAKA
jgi:hypothetical protein